MGTPLPNSPVSGRLLRGRVVFTEAGMEVRRVIVGIHRANDAEKTADLWQAQKLR